MRLIIAEKPELARAIADVIGDGRKTKEKIVCGDTTVTWCYGHLLELTEPADHDEEAGTWSRESLPLVWPVSHKPIKGHVAHLAAIGRMARQATLVVHAGDPDEEGQLLVELVLRHIGNTAPVMRLLIQDLNPPAVTKALGAMRDNSEYRGLFHAALARSVADQRYGFNLTRAYTLAARQAGAQGLLSVGRVQTPILGLVVRRDRARESHSDRHYHELSVRFERTDGQAPGRSVRAMLVIADDLALDEQGRAVDRDELVEIGGDVDGAAGAVSALDAADRTTAPPLPYDLLSLQSDAAAKFGLAPERTLEITQALRENHRLITYNRSDSRYLPEAHHDDAQAVLEAIGATMPAFAPAVAASDAELRSRAFDDTKIGAHHAIIPSGARVEPSALSADETRVFGLIARGYLAQFFPPERYRANKVQIEVAKASGDGHHRFVATSRRTIAPGWKVLFPKAAPKDADEAAEAKDETEEEDGEDLEWLEPGAKVVGSEPTVLDRVTRPPPAYTMATLLKDLSSVAKYVTDERLRALLIDKDRDRAGERGGIGTPATRGAIIAKLMARGYLQQKGKKVHASTLGLEFHDALPASATGPDMTALWHEQQDLIRTGELSLGKFIDGVMAYIGDEVRRADGAALSIAPSGPPCPVCGEGWMLTRTSAKGGFLGCSRYPDCNHTSPLAGEKPKRRRRPRRRRT